MENILYEVQSTAGINIQVIDYPRSRKLKFGNSITQGSFLKDKPDKLSLYYSRDMVSVFEFKKETKNILSLGLGTGTIAKWIHKNYPETEQEIIEICPELPEIGQKYFNIPKDRISYLLEDGFTAIDKLDKKYDLIFYDVYNKSKIPERIRSLNYITRLKNILNTNGILVSNYLTWPYHEEPFLTNWKGIFDYLLVKNPERKSGNIVTFAGIGEIPEYDKNYFLLKR